MSHWKEKIYGLLDREGNDLCADCGTRDPPPHFIAYNIGVFICIKCAGIHQSLGSDYSKSKSIKLGNFDEHTFMEMELMGNEKAKDEYEFSVPQCWKGLSPSSNEDLHQQWIEAKYKRKEFINGADRMEYINGAKYGYLWKKEKKGGQWNKRFFVLSSLTGLICYFLRKEDADPKQSIHIKDLNVTLVDKDVDDADPKQSIHIKDLNVTLVDKEITKKKHSMLISFPTQEEKPKQRHIFLHGETSLDIVNWFLSIRSARLNYLRPFVEGVEPLSVSKLLSRQYLKMGWLWKTGSMKGDAWRKRFVFVDLNRFIYCSTPLDPIPIKEVPIYIDQSVDSFTHLVYEGTNGNHPTPPSNYCFAVKTCGLKQDRVFNFCAETREEMNEWIAAFVEAIQEISWLPDVSDVNKRMSIMSNISSISSRSSICEFNRMSIYSKRGSFDQS